MVHEPNIAGDDRKRSDIQTEIESRLKPDAGTRENGRLWRMRLAALFVGCLPLIVVEAGLRVWAGPIADAVDHDPVVDLNQLKPLFKLRPSTHQWEIPPERFNFFRPASFAATKPPNMRRIFVLGGSTVQGRPYETETAFSTWLQLRLQSADAKHEYEVVNCGGVSYASYRVAKILNEVLKHSPDAIVLYTGHNEFLEDRSYAEVRAMGPARQWLSRMGAKLHTVRWLKSVITPAPTKSTLPTEVNARLDHPGGLAAYQRDPSWKAGVESHFESALQQMIAATKSAGVPLILCVPTSDLINTPPFKAQLDPALDTALKQTFTETSSLAIDERTEPNRRMMAIESCLKLDPQHASAHYLRARLALGAGTTSHANFIAARDHDVCPLRATSNIIMAVKDKARINQVPLVDTVALFDQRNTTGQFVPDGIADPEFFVDHLHPTIAGHQVIASEIARSLAHHWLIHPTSESDKNYRILQEQHLASLGEDYFSRGKQRLAGLKRWTSGRAGQLGTPPQADETPAYSTTSSH